MTTQVKKDENIEDLKEAILSNENKKSYNSSIFEAIRASSKNIS